ncbi:MAG TPA: PEP-CTERM sorting domain-containing protein [Verrucomicrobiae bacterium]|nr:PEP-CTERM sorting domain-containing protein [Verrucomicrobiae bacterium]
MPIGSFAGSAYGELLLAAVPEPSASALLAIGTSLVFVASRWRRTSS